MVVFEQVLTLFSFVILGYILGKSGKIEPQHSKVLSAILVNVFLPFNAIKTFWGNFTVRYLQDNYFLVVSSLVLLVVLAVAGYFGSKLFSRKSYDRKIYEYSLVIANTGYMGYPLTESLYGAAGLMNFMMFCIPISLYIYIYGYAMLTKSKLSLKRLLNPTTIAMAIGMALGLSGVQMPAFVGTILEKGSACMGPISMLLTGIVVSEYSFKEILTDKKIYILSAVRLLVVPIVVGFSLKLLGFEEVLQYAMLGYALPCGLNTVVFAKLVNENCKIGVGIALVSHLVACASIPLVFWMFQL